MQIEAQFRRRAHPTDDVRELNQRMLAFSSLIPGFWAEGKSPHDSYFDPGRGESAAADISQCLATGIEVGISYASRLPGSLSDTARCDDVLSVRIDERDVDFLWFSRTIFPQLVRGFFPYRASVVTDLELDLHDFELICQEAQATNVDIDGRDTVYRFHCVNFYDKELCLRAFGLTPEQLSARLNNAVQAEVYEHGLLLIGSDAPLVGHQLLDLDRKLKSLLAACETD